MPSEDHQALVELFRSNPALARVLLALSGGIEIAAGEGRVVDSNLSVPPPLEWRPDLVITFGTGKRQQAVLVEVQLSHDSTKAEVWPMYLTATRLRHHCQAFLLVIPSDAALADWCARKIETGQPGFDLRPIVVGPQQLPALTDVELARRCPELAILSAYLHRGTEHAVDAAAAAVLAIAELDASPAFAYNDLIRRWLPPKARAAFEEKIMSFPETYVCQSYFAKEHQAKGRAEGFATGLEQGLAKAVLSVISERGLPVAAEHEERIRACGDSGQLDRWLRRAVAASSLDEIFAE